MRPQAAFKSTVFLKSVPLFADLDHSALAALARVSHKIAVPKGKLVFSEGDPADSAYVVYTGAISIVLCTPDGRELVINDMHTGDCFGELGLLTGGRRTASAAAREDSQLILIPREEFLREIQTQPQLLRHLLEMIGERLRASTVRESAFAFLDASARVARIVLELDRAAVRDGYITTSQEDISRRTGIARQTAAEILGRWRRKGWIITGRGKLVVLDRAALRKQCHELEQLSVRKGT